MTSGKIRIGSSIVIHITSFVTSLAASLIVTSLIVTIYKGIRESLGPLKFSVVYEKTGLAMADLPDYQRYLVERSITATDRQDADRILHALTEAVVNK